MKNKKLIMTSALSTALVALLLVFFGPNVANMLKHAQDKSLGATSVQVTDGDCLLAPGGGHICAYTSSLSATSSIACAFKSPAATSTLTGTPFIKYTTIGGFAGTENVFLSTSTNAFGSSTPFIGFVKPATNGFYPFSLSVASTSIFTSQLVTVGANGVSANVIAPNTFVTFRMGTTTPGTFTTYPTGTCSATFSY